jgi:pyruvate/2-oxoglutarate/acetoin dehydrogenase E1 component
LIYFTTLIFEKRKPRFRGHAGKYGALRVADVGIREATIIGQGIGMALRGLRPIAEIQYLDYLLYAIQIMSDVENPTMPEQ